MNIVKVIYDYFKDFTDAPNPSLIRDISDHIEESDPSKGEFRVFVDTIVDLRTTYRYEHPLEDLADWNDAHPYTRHLGNKFRGKKQL